MDFLVIKTTSSGFQWMSMDIPFHPNPFEPFEPWKPDHLMAEDLQQLTLHAAWSAANVPGFKGRRSVFFQTQEVDAHRHLFFYFIYFSLRYFAVHCFGSIFVTSKKIRHKMHFHISDYDSTWQPGNKKKLRPMTHREDHPKPLQKANYSFSPVWQPGWF